MTPSNPALLPLSCPYCGIEAKEIYGDYCFIHKDDCFLARGSQTQWLTSKDVIECWNTRTPAVASVDFKKLDAAIDYYNGRKISTTKPLSDMEVYHLNELFYAAKSHRAQPAITDEMVCRATQKFCSMHVEILLMERMKAALEAEWGSK